MGCRTIKLLRLDVEGTALSAVATLLVLNASLIKHDKEGRGGYGRILTEQQSHTMGTDTVC